MFGKLAVCALAAEARAARRDGEREEREAYATGRTDQAYHTCFFVALCELMPRLYVRMRVGECW